MLLAVANMLSLTPTARLDRIRRCTVLRWCCLCLTASFATLAAADCLDPPAVVRGPVRVQVCSDAERRLTLVLANNDTLRAATVQVGHCQLDYGEGLNMEASLAWPVVQVPPQGRVTLPLGTQHLPRLHAARCQISALTLGNGVSNAPEPQVPLAPGVPPGSPAQLGKSYGTEPEPAPRQHETAVAPPTVLMMPPGQGRRNAPASASTPGTPTSPSSGSATGLAPSAAPSSTTPATSSTNSAAALPNASTPSATVATPSPPSPPVSPVLPKTARPVPHSGQYL